MQVFASGLLAKPSISIRQRQKLRYKLDLLGIGRVPFFEPFLEKLAALGMQDIADDPGHAAFGRLRRGDAARAGIGGGFKAVDEGIHRRYHCRPKAHHARLQIASQDQVSCIGRYFPGSIGKRHYFGMGRRIIRAIHRVVAARDNRSIASAPELHRWALHRR